MGGFRKSPMKSPEEMGGDSRPQRGGRASREEGGFADGEAGRGSTPFKMKHTKKPDGFGMEHFVATAGRGGAGIAGKGDGFKTHAEDLEHPQSHADFEALGTETDGSGGRD